MSISELTFQHKPTSNGVVSSDQIPVSLPGKLLTVHVNIVDSNGLLRKGDCYAQLGVTTAKTGKAYFSPAAGYIGGGGAGVSWEGVQPMRGNEFISIATRCFHPGVILEVIGRVEVN